MRNYSKKIELLFVCNEFSIIESPTNFIDANPTMMNST